MPCAERSVTCPAVSCVDEPRTGQDRLAAAGQQAVLGELGDDEDAQVALQVLLLVDGEQDRAVLDRGQHFRRQVERRQHDLIVALEGSECRCGAGRTQREDAVDRRILGECRLDGALRTGRIGQVNADDRRRDSAQAVGEALAALVERLVADFLVDAQRVRDAGLGHARAGPLARDELGLAHVGQDAELLVGIDARVDAHDRDPGILGALDRVTEGLGVRVRDHEPIRRGRHGGVDQLRHGDHVEGLRGVIVDRDAEVGGRLVDAVLHDRPERVGCLAVGDDLDRQITAGRAAAASGRACLLVAARGKDEGEHREADHQPSVAHRFSSGVDLG